MLFAGSAKLNCTCICTCSAARIFEVVVAQKSLVTKMLAICRLPGLRLHDLPQHEHHLLFWSCMTHPGHFTSLVAPLQTSVPDHKQHSHNMCC